MQSTTSSCGTKDAIARAVRAELARRRYSQKRVRELTGWSIPFLARRMAGTVEFSLTEIVELSKAIGADPAAVAAAAVAEMAAAGDTQMAAAA